MPEFAYITGQPPHLEVVSEDADIRVPAPLWKRYVDARAKLASVQAELDARAERPLVVAPEQESVMRAAARPGVWIVVRQPASQAADTASYAPPPAADERFDPQQVVVPFDSSAAGPSQPERRKRPPLGPCAARSNLPHQSVRYAVTTAASVYYPGRKRVDGICQCGLRIADVRCPHQHQKPGVKVPTCAWCDHVLVVGAGLVDNRDANGNPDPRIKTFIPIGATGDDPAVVAAGRSEDGA